MGGKRVLLPTTKRILEFRNMEWQLLHKPGCVTFVLIQPAVVCIHTLSPLLDERRVGTSQHLHKSTNLTPFFTSLVLIRTKVN